jgi:hypothetical protein
MENDLQNRCSKIILTKVSCVLCITDGTQLRKVIVFLQSCTVSMPVPQFSCNETSAMCIDACDVISVKREEDRRIDSDVISVKREEDRYIDSDGDEVPFATLVRTIKCEQDEVSYISVCLLLSVSIQKC